MPIKIVLELAEEDLDYYRGVMDSVWKKNQKRAEKELIAVSYTHLTLPTKA